MIYNDYPLYVCENCGWDVLDHKWGQIDDPQRTLYYSVYKCRMCDTKHVHRDWQPLLRAAGLDRSAQ